MSVTSERIRQRREELGLTIDDLAEILGKNRTTIYRYETGFIENMPIKVIGPLAKALSCSPSYLMGWVDDPNWQPEINNLTNYDIILDSHKEREIIRRYREKHDVQKAVDILLGLGDGE